MITHAGREIQKYISAVKVFIIICVHIRVVHLDVLHAHNFAPTKGGCWCGWMGLQQRLEGLLLRHQCPWRNFPTAFVRQRTTGGVSDGWGTRLQWNLPHITRSDSLTDPSQPEKLQFSQLLNARTQTERMDPQCISGLPHAKSMRSVDGRMQWTCRVSFNNFPAPPSLTEPISAPCHR